MWRFNLYRFRRPFRGLELVFPGSGIGSREFPIGVEETVIPVWEALKPRPGDVVFNSFALAGNANAADFTLGANAPSSGSVRFIYAAAATHADGTNVRNLDVRLVANTTAKDPWGDYFTLAGGTRVVGAVEVTGARWASLPHIPPVFPSTNLSFVFHGMTGGGEQVQVHYVYADLPGELLTIENR